MSRGLRTPPLPGTHASVGDCWQNSRCCHLLREEQHSFSDTLVSHPNDQAQRRRPLQASETPQTQIAAAVCCSGWFGSPRPGTEACQERADKPFGEPSGVSRRVCPAHNPAANAARLPVASGVCLLLSHCVLLFRAIRCCAGGPVAQEVSKDGDSAEVLSFPLARPVPMPPGPGSRRLTRPSTSAVSPGNSAWSRTAQFAPAATGSPRRRRACRRRGSAGRPARRPWTRRAASR